LVGKERGEKESSGRSEISRVYPQGGHENIHCEKKDKTEKGEKNNRGKKKMFLSEGHWWNVKAEPGEVGETRRGGFSKLCREKCLLVGRKGGLQNHREHLSWIREKEL